MLVEPGLDAVRGDDAQMALIQIDATADVLRGLHEVQDLDLPASSIEDLGADRYRMSGHAPEALIPALEARGCTVRVLMSTQAIEEFHSDVVASIAWPTED
jgi:hypothetical protein